MRKTICIWIGAIGFCIVSFFAQRAYFLQKNLKLYADNNPQWEKDDIIVGGIEVYKYINRSEDNYE